MNHQHVINSIVESIPDAPLHDTVDVFKCGNPEQETTGIVTTFTATMHVLHKAVALGANLIITHEPTFYSHRDDMFWLSDSPVFQAKKRFVEEHQLTVWRFHDDWHRHQPDGIRTGILRALGWEPYWDPIRPRIVTLPDLSLGEVVDHLKKGLQMETIRAVGDLTMTCRHVGLGLGAIGGDAQIRYFEQGVDTLLVGETVEWQTCEYVRDSTLQGKALSLLILGHADSEELGMKYLVEWLRPKVGDIPITFVPAGNPVVCL